ncbi:beta-carotene 15,15'-monooxygenase [Viridibacillus sp. YIM B01967]|uniref:Beta-carotene 15,15'-monooxygenase n=1 Tax=Viridibacillus soli TaxID=2798301 RepID=A0ABS1H8F0_9BACL|nr:beta-carotene 15,15'-monooxygenase [Viridibacillus soli]MBK3495697.1 beta-carotene 15,15'-monooxygenase [Viridibacillus soli]
MVATERDLKSYIWMALLVLVLSTNFALYRTPLSGIILQEETKAVILGSLLDLAIVIPLLILAIDRKNKFTIKRFIMLMAGGLIFAKLLIPAHHLEPFVAFSYVGFAIEGSVVLLELSLIGLLFILMPAVMREVRTYDEDLLFAFPKAVQQKVSKKRIVQMIVSDLLMYYYAFASWKKPIPVASNTFTLHKKSSLLAFQIMLIHAIVIETIGIHWWLHEKSMVLSIILLVLNVYTVIFFLGDIQAVRLNPVRLKEQKLYLSLGLAKQMELSIDDIESITIDQEELEKKLDSKTAIEFVARDFEVVHPHVILELKKPCTASILLGFKKQYSRVAIRLDDPATFKQALQQHLQVEK